MKNANCSSLAQLRPDLLLPFLNFDKKGRRLSTDTRPPRMNFFLTLILLTLITPFISQAQVDGFCSTPNPEGGNSCEYIPYLGTTGPYYVKIKVTVIRDQFGQIGTNGHSPEDVDEILNILHADFAPHNIFFIWDCVINYIDDDNLFYDSDGDDSVFGGPSNDNEAINIYLFPDSQWPSTGQGKANGLCGLAYYVAGNYFKPPHNSLCKSHIISHEMGHCLGLYHTFSGAQVINDPQCANNSVFTTQGDYVCDSAPDIYGGNEVNHPNCEFPVNNISIPGDPKNIMSYSHPDCMEYFTPGQGQRMRDMLAQNPSMTSALQIFQFDNLTINNSQHWTLSNFPNGVDIRGDLTISHYGNLTIGAGVEVRMSNQSKLIVKRGGILTLNGGVLDAQCNATWPGIIVEGKRSSPQASIANSPLPYEQGRFFASSGAYIKNADIAVQVGTDNKNGGGVVVFNDATFENNRVGVIFKPYEGVYPPPIQHSGNPPNKSSFTNCLFLTDNNIRFKKQQPQVNAITMNFVRGINILGCQFINEYINENPSDYSDAGYGIISFASNFKVGASGSGAQGSFFSGWGYGIYASERDVAGLPVAPFGLPYTIVQSTFEKCYVGVFHSEASNMTIAYNIFYLGDLTNAQLAMDSYDQIGLALESQVIGMTVQENSFIGVEETPYLKIGTFCSKLTTSRNLSIRRNHYTGLNVHNAAAYSNGTPTNAVVPAGLLYECNTNTAALDADFYVYQGGVIKVEQGKPINDLDYGAAGNTFSVTPEWHLRNQGAFYRYHFDKDKPDQVPDPLKVTSGTVLLIVDDENNCPVEVPNPGLTEGETDDVDIEKIRYFSHDGPYQTAITNINNSNVDVAESAKRAADFHRREMDFASANILRILLNDTLKDQSDSIRAWLLRMNSYEADIAIAQNYLRTGNVESALGVLDGATQKFNLSSVQAADLNELRSIFEIVIQQDEEGTLSESQTQWLRNIANHPETGYAPYTARNILEARGEHYPPHLPVIDLLRQSHERTPINQNKLLVSPNPASSSITFTMSGTAGQLCIANAQGQVIYKTPFTGLIQWNTQLIPDGFYVWRLLQDDGATQSGKVIIQH